MTARVNCVEFFLPIKLHSGNLDQKMGEIEILGELSLFKEHVQ